MIFARKSIIPFLKGRGNGMGQVPSDPVSHAYAEVMLSGGSFHRLAPETGNAHLPTVVIQKDSTSDGGARKPTRALSPSTSAIQVKCVDV